MNKTELSALMRMKKSFLCVGLDTELSRIPKHLLQESDPVFSFNKAIIDATAPYTVAYKPNTAFYEENGAQGWISLEMTIQYIRDHYPEMFIIADAKRGDIGNTSERYAKAFFNKLNADAVTVAPYMGHDSVSPFLGFKDKWVILLALTSNKGSLDFQYLSTEEDFLFEKVLEKACQWGTDEQLMFVVGATHPDEFKVIRQRVPDHFFLVPGVGAQGGDLQAVCDYGLNRNIGLIINSSRGIIYKSSGEDFATAAAKEAFTMQQQMESILWHRGLI
jgi:orotidine-5'-phosphate decarboxylase